MIDTDFVYDNLRASDIGLMICQFEGASGFETMSKQPAITFGNVSQHAGGYFCRTSSALKEPAQLDFSICRVDGEYMTHEFAAEVNKWLCRNDFHELVFDGDEFTRRYFGSFNTSNVLHCGKIVGMNLTFTADSPYGYGDIVTEEMNISSGAEYGMPNRSFENIPIYPERVTIVAGGAGDIIISNENGGRETIVKNCSAGEIITMDSKNYIISSSDASHNLYNDFNYVFVRVSPDDTNVFINDGVDCTITITYRTYFKVVV